MNSALNPLYIAMCNSLLVENFSKLEQTVCAENSCMQEAWTNTCAISAGFVVTKDVFMVAELDDPAFLVRALSLLGFLSSFAVGRAAIV